MASLVLMDAARMRRTLVRIAHEILERHPNVASLALVGIRSRGVPLARRLAAFLGETTGVEPSVGALDITLYRDDFTTLAPQPITRGTDILFSIDARTVVLVDDVLFTGRTVRAALDQLIDFGRPARIELAVLVDRGHRELPIRADYVGRTLSTARNEAVEVRLREEDGADEIVLVRGGGEGNRAAGTKEKAGGPRKGPKGAAPRKPAARKAAAGKRAKSRPSRRRSRR